MPKVPTYRSNIGPERGPVVYQDVRGLSPNSFGAAQGRGLQNLGQATGQTSDILADQALRMAKQRSAVERIRDFGTASEQLNQMLLTEQTVGSNFADPQAVVKFRQGVDQIIQKAIANHKGGEDSRVQLMGLLEQERFRFHDQATNLGIKAQNDAMDGQLQGILTNLSAQASRSPENIPTLVAQWDRTIANFADTITPAREEILRRAGRERIAQEGANYALAVGDLDSAKTLANSGWMSDDQASTTRARIIAFETEKDREAAKLQANVDVWEGILGRTLSDEEKMAFGPFSPEKAGPAETIREYERVMSERLGKPYTATPDEVSKAFDMLGEEKSGPFGDSLKGRALNIAHDLTPIISNGLASKEQVSLALGAAAAIRQPDAQGQRTELPPDFAFALGQIGISLDFLDQMADQQGAVMQHITDLDREGVVPTTDQARPAPQQQSQAAQPQAPSQGGDTIQAGTPPTFPDLPKTPQEAERADSEFKIALDAGEAVRGGGNPAGLLAPGVPLPPMELYKIAPLIAGIDPTVERTIGSIPETSAEGRQLQMIFAAQYARIVSQDITEILRKSKHGAQAETKELKEEVFDLNPSSWDNADAYRTRVVSVDAYARGELKYYQERLENKQLSLDVRQDAAEKISVLEKYIDILGAPSQVQSIEQLDEMIANGGVKSGDPIFFIPSGELWVMP